MTLTARWINRHPILANRILDSRASLGATMKKYRKARDKRNKVASEMRRKLWPR